MNKIILIFASILFFVASQAQVYSGVIPLGYQNVSNTPVIVTANCSTGISSPIYLNLDNDTSNEIYFQSTGYCLTLSHLHCNLNILDTSIEINYQWGFYNLCTVIDSNQLLQNNIIYGSTNNWSNNLVTDIAEFDFDTYYNVNNDTTTIEYIPIRKKYATNTYAYGWIKVRRYLTTTPSLNLVVKIDDYIKFPPHFSEILDTINCGDNYTFINNFTLNNIHHDTIYSCLFSNPNTGLDSLVITKLNVISPYTPQMSVINDSICRGSTYYFLDGSDTLTGVYTNNLVTKIITLPSISGCDSLITTNVFLKSNSYLWLNNTICSNQLPYNFNGQILNSSGYYYDTLTNAIGCDSIISLQLIVKQPSYKSISVTKCSNSIPQYIFNGQILTQSGIYYDTLINSVGCDSLITLNLTINQPSSSSSNASVCSNQLPYSWNGQNLTSAGLHTYQTTNAAGCDSIDTLNLTIIQSTSSTTNVSVCSNQLPYSWNGQNYTTGGLHTYQTTNSVGCDSIATLNLTIINIPLSNIIPYTDSTICIGNPIVLYVDTSYSNYSWTLNGNIVSATDSVIINSNGSYLLSCTDSNNCYLTDSISITLNPLSQPIIVQINYVLYCTNVSANNYQWILNNIGIGSNSDSLLITQNGTYIVITTDTFGCKGIDTFVVSALALNNYSTNNSFNIYPNPTENSLIIYYDLDKTSTVDIKLLDMTGKVISNITNNENQTKGNHKKVVNLKSLSISEGMYMLQLNDGVSNYNQRIIYRN